MENKEIIRKNLERFKNEIVLMDVVMSSLSDMRKALIRGSDPKSTFEEVTFNFNKTLLGFNELGNLLYPSVAKSFDGESNKIIN